MPRVFLDTLGIIMVSQNYKQYTILHSRFPIVKNQIKLFSKLLKVTFLEK